jgi:hypothetical protein
MLSNNYTIKTNSRKAVINRKAIIIKAIDRKNVSAVISAIRAAGVNNPVETDNAWNQFKQIGTDGRLHFSTYLFKSFLFDHGYISEAELNDDKCSLKILLPAALKAFNDGVMPVKLTKQAGIIGFCPIRLSRDFSGKMLKMWAFSTVSLVNPFCLARMKDPNLVCYNCYVEASLHLEGALNYVQNFFFLTISGLPEILLPELNPAVVAMHKYIRLESFGDIANYAQMSNYNRIASINAPAGFNFTIWSKNVAIVARVFDAEGKAVNLKFQHSMSRVNMMDSNYLKYKKYVDGWFLVVDNDADRKRFLGRHHAHTCKCCQESCYSICQRCYIEEPSGAPLLHVERLRVQ